MSIIQRERWISRLGEEGLALVEQFVRDTQAGIRRPKALLLYGPGNDGKTVLIDEIRAHLGEDQCAYVASQLMNETLRPVLPKLVVLVDGDDGLKEGVFNEVMSDGQVAVRPLYSARSYVNPQWNVIFERNTLDLPEAVLRRCEIVRFHKPNAVPSG